MLDISDVAARYGASLVTLYDDGGEASVPGPGGGLRAQVERRGLLPLAQHMALGSAIVLEDEGVSLRLERRAREVLVRADWAEGGRLEDVLACPAPPSAPPPEAAPLPPRAPRPRAGSDAVGFAPDPASRVGDLRAALHDPDLPLYATDSGVYLRGALAAGAPPLRAIIPAVAPEALGSADFREAHDLRASYGCSPLSHGITGSKLVTTLARDRLLGFFGSPGLDVGSIRDGIGAMVTETDPARIGVAMPALLDDFRLDEAVIDLVLAAGVRRVLTRASSPPTPALVRFRVAGMRRGPDGRILRRNHLFVQAGSPEAALPWMRPPAPELLAALVERREITAEQAALASELPLAEDLVAEGHAGGRTERWPLLALLPVLLRARDRLLVSEGYQARGAALRVGATGELGDPASIHAAFALGADFVLTGSINQASVEAATSLASKELLAEAGVADCATAPASERFEVGGRVQVLSRGTRFAQQAERLYDVYRRYRSIAEIPEGERRHLERTIFNRNLEEVWAEVEADLIAHRPAELVLSREDPRHRMALLFRGWLDACQRAARQGTAGRQRDYQIWCGPAMGLFNDWVRGTWLQPLVARGVVPMADALLLGAACLQRVAVARTAGVVLPPGVEAPLPVQMP